MFCRTESDSKQGRQEHVPKLSTSARTEAGQTQAGPAFFPSAHTGKAGSWGVSAGGGMQAPRGTGLRGPRTAFTCWQRSMGTCPGKPPQSTGRGPPRSTSRVSSLLWPPVLWETGGHASCHSGEAHKVSPCPVKDPGAAGPPGARLMEPLGDAVRLGMQEPSTPWVRLGCWCSTRKLCSALQPLQETHSSSPSSYTSS